LAALSGSEQELGRLLSYRFQRGEALEGHTFGNLLITTLTEVEGDFGQALRTLNSLLDLQGAVYPASADTISLLVEKENSELILGESLARSSPGPIRSVELRPDAPLSLPEVIQAISLADLIVLGPGSLFTSTVPPLLVPQIRHALHMTGAQLAYVSNIMTEAGETDHFSTFDHVEALEHHLGRYPHYVLVSTSEVDPSRRRGYLMEGAEVVEFHESPFILAGIQTIQKGLLGSGPLAQHDSDNLAKILVDLARSLPLRPKDPVPVQPC
jgi:uncharacterized cofD-like protein